MTAAIENAVHRPDAPDHFFVLRPVAQLVTCTLREREIAASKRAFWLLEGGKTLYPPVIYMPPEDVKITLARVPENTHCPLKGDATYFIEEGDGRIRKLAWSYENPFEFSTAIKGLIAFDPALIQFTLSPR
ncbi:MAG: DUF427 domain-containing protein [Pseudomonadota bacterium]